MKNTFLFVLSGEHPTLPLAELEAVIGTYSDYEMLDSRDNLAVFRTSRGGNRFIKELAERLALTHKILELTGISKETGILNLMKELPKIKMPYRVRVHLDHSKDETENMERQIGVLINDVLVKKGKKPAVEMKNPKTSLEFFFAGGKIYFGILQREIGKKGFNQRKPLNRPFFRPVSMDPRIARAMVNLGRTRKGRILDPFCGTGGILIEAGLSGLRVYGTDMDPEMVRGTEMNLERFGVKGNVTEGDSMKLEDHYGRNFFDLIVTCPPYGRLSSLKGEKIGELYRKSTESMERVLKKGGFLVMGAPTNINIKTNMQLIEIHKERINRSLSRNIMVFRK